MAWPVTKHARADRANDGSIVDGTGLFDPFFYDARSDEISSGLNRSHGCRTIFRPMMARINVRASQSGFIMLSYHNTSRTKTQPGCHPGAMVAFCGRPDLQELH